MTQQGNILQQLPTYAETLVMNRQSSFVFLVLLLLAQQSVAQTPGSSLLWEISGNGLKQPSYLFGTFHLMCKSDFSVSPMLESKLKASSQFYGELKMDDPQLQTKLMGRMMLSGQTLQTLLPQSDYTAVSTQFQSITGYPLLAFNNFKPFLCLSILAQKSIACTDAVQPETEFVSLAKQLSLPILGLETVDDQMDAIDKEPIDSQISSLKKTVLNFDSVKTMMVEMSDVYKLRDIDSLYRYMKTNGVDGAFETELLNNRNKKWVPMISEIIAEKPSFFAVGAGHLGGPDGVISLLRKKGYRLTPVKF
ncbi:MAG: TraB/GumN family protein [Bacteroidota bacterium]